MCYEQVTQRASYNSSEKISSYSPINYFFKREKLKWFTCNLKLHVTDTMNMHKYAQTQAQTHHLTTTNYKKTHHTHTYTFSVSLFNETNMHRSKMFGIFAYLIVVVILAQFSFQCGRIGTQTDAQHKNKFSEHRSFVCLHMDFSICVCVWARCLSCENSSIVQTIWAREKSVTHRYMFITYFALYIFSAQSNLTHGILSKS